MSMKVSKAGLQAQINALAALANGGVLVVYDGTQPTDANTALGGSPSGTPPASSSNHILATFSLNSTAFGNGSNASPSVAAANGTPISASVSATGTASFARMYKSDQSTVVADFAITATGGGGDITFPTTSFVSGETASLTSFSLSQPTN